MSYDIEIIEKSRLFETNNPHESLDLLQDTHLPCQGLASSYLPGRLLQTHVISSPNRDYFSDPKWFVIGKAVSQLLHAYSWRSLVTSISFYLSMQSNNKVVRWNVPAQRENITRFDCYKHYRTLRYWMDGDAYMHTSELLPPSLQTTIYLAITPDIPASEGSASKHSLCIRRYRDTYINIGEAAVHVYPNSTLHRDNAVLYALRTKIVRRIRT